MRTPEEKRKNREHELELAGPFLTVLAVLTLVAFLLPLRPETSMRERRRLREFPAFSVESLLSGDWFDGITAWFSDSFPGRETMLEVSNRMDALHGLNKNEVALGSGSSAGTDNAELDALLEQAEAAAAARAEEPETVMEAEPEPEQSGPADPNEVIESWEGLDAENEAAMYGDLVLIDGTVMSRLGFSRESSDLHASLMNRGADVLAEKGIRFFNLPAPTSSGILLSSDRLAELECADQGKTLRYMFAQENGNVGKVNAFNNLLSHNSEYVYYHSDHHWTALGAYYAYEEFCSVAGFDPVPLSEYEEVNMGDFTGSWYYSINPQKVKHDEMIAYIPPGNIHMEIAGFPNVTSPVVDKTDDEPNMKYNCFLNGDNPITVLVNDDLPDAPDCLVYKDSFGNPFAVYLAQHYHRVYVLDYRYNFTAASITAEQYGVSDVVLVQSIGVSQSMSAMGLLQNLMN